MLLNRPLGQPEYLLVTFRWSALIGLSQEEKITALIAFMVKDYRDPTATLMKSDNIHPLELFNQLVRQGRLVFPQTENVPSRCWPAVLDAKDNPRLISSQNLQAVGKTLISAFLQYPGSLSHYCFTQGQRTGYF